MSKSNNSYHDSTSGSLSWFFPKKTHNLIPLSEQIASRISKLHSCTCFIRVSHLIYVFDPPDGMANT